MQVDEKRSNIQNDLNQYEQNSTGWDILPPELLANIFRFCDSRSLGTALLVNKDWKIVSEDEINFRFPNKETADYIKVLASCCKFNGARKLFIEQKFNNEESFDKTILDIALVLESFPLILKYLSESNKIHSTKWGLDDQFFNYLYTLFISDLEDNLECIRECLSKKYIDPFANNAHLYYNILLPIMEKACDFQRFDIALKIYTILFEFGFTTKTTHQRWLDTLVKKGYPFEETQKTVELLLKEGNKDNLLILLSFAQHLIDSKPTCQNQMSLVTQIAFCNDLISQLDQRDVAKILQISQKIIKTLLQNYSEEKNIPFEILKHFFSLSDTELKKIIEELTFEGFYTNSQSLVYLIKSEEIKKSVNHLIEIELIKLASELDQIAKISYQEQIIETDLIKRGHLENCFSKYVRDNYENKSDSPLNSNEWFENFINDLTEKNELELLGYFVKLISNKENRERLCSLISEIKESSYKQESIYQNFDLFNEIEDEMDHNSEEVDDFSDEFSDELEEVDSDS